MHKKIAVIVAALLLVTVGVAIWSNYDSPKESKEKEAIPAEVTLNSVGSRAAAYVANGEIDKALTHYDEQIKLTQDEREKKSLLIKKAIVATDIGRYDEAIASAKQADEMESDMATMRALADAYAANGDKEEALVYYRKLLALEKPAPEVEEGRPGMQLGPSVENIIKELEQ